MNQVLEMNWSVSNLIPPHSIEKHEKQSNVIPFRRRADDMIHPALTRPDLPNALPSSLALVEKLRRQYGDRNFVRFARNVGIDFNDCYQMMFGRESRK